ncbi:MAG: hypothetical protein WA842_13580 [Croceibacterium sp.]
MLRRFATPLLLLLVSIAFGGAAAQSGLDRLSRQDPAKSVLVAGPFASSAANARARMALIAKQYPLARDLARVAMVRTPIEAQSSSMLGAALLAMGDFKGAEAAYRVAVQGGWRDNPTQAYWATAAIGSGEFPAAAQRIDAMLRVGAPIATLEPLLASMEASPDGRQALAGQMASGAPWVSTYAAFAGAVAGPRLPQQLAVLGAARKLGARAECGPVSDTLNTLAYRQQRMADAYLLWSVACSETYPPAAIANGDFAEPVRAVINPFDWQLPPAGAAWAEIRGGALETGNDGDKAAVVARIAAHLPSGDARLTWRVDSAPRQRMVELRCGQVNLAVGEARKLGDVYELPVRIPANCPFATIEVIAEPGQPTLRFESVGFGA